MKGESQSAKGLSYINSKFERLFEKCSPVLREYILTVGEDTPIPIEFLARNDTECNALLSSQASNLSFHPSSTSSFLVGFGLVTYKQLLQLASNDCIENLEWIRKPATELKQEGLDLSLNEISLLHTTAPELKGTHMTLSYKENNPDSTDIDFRGRYFSTPRTSPIRQLHATNMASIATGGGNSSTTAKGVAWDAFLTSSDFAVLLPDPTDYFQTYSISAQNHSYGTGIENYYGIETMAYDELCFNNPELVHVFSSGNDGDQAPATGIYAGLPGWANLTGQFKQSKNNMTIGACDSLGNVVPLSSRGPAYDGRIKPELIAYGHGGSSGAAAIVSGVSLLLQEAYKKENNEELPPAALIKALLINSAHDIGAVGPDFISGYGLVRAHEAYEALEQGRYLVSTIGNGQFIQQDIMIPEGTSQLKATIVWNDPPADVDQQKALINDLDIVLIQISSGDQWHPWVLNTYPLIDSLVLPAQRSVDSLNNVEQITIDQPAAGLYSIMVKGKKVTQGQQDFALVWEYQSADKFQWTYPTAGDFPEPSRDILLRWNASTGQTGQIEYRAIEEESWHLVKEDVSSGAQLVHWETPDATGRFQLRWIGADTVIHSDTFIISHPLQPKVGFLCADSLQLHWTSNRADSFEIFRIGEKHLEHYAYATDTVYVDANPDNGNRHYAVAGLFKGMRGPLSYGLDVDAQAAGCYLNSFFLLYVSGGNAFFESNLGTLSDVEAVILEKFENGNYIPLLTVSPVEDLKIFLESNALSQGVNYFRVRVVLKSGNSIYSDVIPVYYSGEHKILLFPNPVASGDELQILASSVDFKSLQIIDMLGRKIINLEEADYPQAVSLSGFPSGLYNIVIRYADGRIDTEGFVVRE